MPLQTVSPPWLPSALATVLKEQATKEKPAFLIVYSGINDDGEFWCPDCSDAEPYLTKKFEGRDDTVRVVYVGSKEAWRSKDHPSPWRAAPFSATGVPTLIKVTGDGKWGRIVETVICDQEKLDAFVGF